MSFVNGKPDHTRGQAVTATGSASPEETEPVDDASTAIPAATDGSEKGGVPMDAAVDANVASDGEDGEDEAVEYGEFAAEISKMSMAQALRVCEMEGIAPEEPVLLGLHTALRRHFCSPPPPDHVAATSDEPARAGQRRCALEETETKEPASAGTGAAGAAGQSADWGALSLTSPTSTDFWQMIDELEDDQSGFLSNRTFIADAWKDGRLHCLTVGETDSMFERKAACDPIFCDGTVYLLPCFAVTSTGDKTRCEILWTHARAQRIGLGTALVEQLGIVAITNQLAGSGKFWEACGTRLGRPELYDQKVAPRKKRRVQPEGV